MNYRRQLFQIERWSPQLARKIWGMAKFLESPFSLALGLKISHFTDTEVEVQVPPSVALAGAEFASRILWQRHLKSGVTSLFLNSIKAEFLKEPLTTLVARAELTEDERENILRKLNNGQTVIHEMPVTLIDNKRQNLGLVNCTWRFKLLKPLSIQGGV